MSQKNSFKNYVIAFKPSALKELGKLNRLTVCSIDQKLQDLVAGLSNVDIKKMKSCIDIYRMRCGDYRIVFEANKMIITILVVKIAHRKDVYRDY